MAKDAVENDGPAYGPELEGFPYPWPVSYYEFTSQGAPLHMAYMDVKPATPNGRTVILLHGKNYVAATWQTTIAVLERSGLSRHRARPDRLRQVDQTRSLPIQYSSTGREHACAPRLTRHRPRHRGGAFDRRHARGALRAHVPRNVDQLALVDPIGLEDWKAKGVPWQSIDAMYQQELQTTADRIREYERTTYYAGTWSPPTKSGCRCLPDCIAVPAGTSSPGTRHCSRT